MTHAELAILSLIVEAPRHGYEIEQIIEARGMRDWTEVGFSSIYYNLKKLAEKGLVTAQTGDQTGRGPAPKVYSVTPAGANAWQTAMLELLSRPAHAPTPFLLGLAALPALPPDAAIDALSQYRASLAERRAHISARREAQRPLPAHVETLFDHSLTLVSAEIDWLDQFIRSKEGEN